MTNGDQIQDLLAKFQLGEPELALVAEAGRLLEPELPSFIHDWYEWLGRQREYQFFFAGSPQALERVQRLQFGHWQQFLKGRVTEDIVNDWRHIGVVHARIDLPNDIFFAGTSQAIHLLLQRLRRLAPSRLPEMELALLALHHLQTSLVVEEISRIQREKIAQHSRAVMEVSTPVTPIWEGILLLPLLGIIDSARTQDIMNKTLSKISELRAKVFVMDISGVSSVDTAVANQLIKITKATRLMGCEAIISGISPAIARTIVELGVNVGEVRTTATLRDAFEIALRMVGEERQVRALMDGDAR